MRVNLEDDLHLSGRLAAFSRFLGLCEEQGVGRLYWVYRETQSRELVTMSRSEFVNATELRIANPDQTLDALVRSKLATEDGGAITIHGNDAHVERIRKLRGMASAGGKARHAGSAAATATQPVRSRTGSRTGSRTAADTQAPPQRSLLPAPYSLLQKQDPDLCVSDCDLPLASNLDDLPRSLLSSDAKNSVGLTPSPSAPVVLEKAKRKERSAEQKTRGLANNRLYRELYTAAEGHPPTGLDQAFNGMMAKFSDKHAEGAEQILRWVFERCPDKSFRTKGWPLELIVQQAPRLWRELNNPRAAVENIAAPRQQQQLALAASNDLAFEEYQRRKAERLASANQI